MKQNQDVQQYLTFMLQEDLFGVNITAIKEIIEYGQLTEVPMMPASIRGVINLRGRVVPVLDLRARFGKEQTQVNRRTCIVILEIYSDEGMQELGIMVDAVNEVLEILTEQIEPAPSFGASIKTSFIHGMGKVNGKFVILLNVDQVLSVGELSAVAGNSEAMEAAEVL